MSRDGAIYPHECPNDLGGFTKVFGSRLANLLEVRDLRGSEVACSNELPVGKMREYPVRSTGVCGSFFIFEGFR